MEVERSYKFRFYPTAAQQAALRRWFGAARWVWNHCLEYRSKAYRRRGERVTGTDYSRLLTRIKDTPGHAWLREVPATVLTQKLRDQDQAFSNFFAGRARYPRFRSRRRHAQSVRLQIDQRRVGNYVYLNQKAPEQCWLKVPGLGRVKLRWSRVPGGLPKMVTVSRDAAGRWWVSFMVREAVEPLAESTRAVGLDRGLKDLVVGADHAGREVLRVAHPKPLARASAKLRRAQRALSRRRRGSGRWHAQRRRVARLHACVQDRRTDFLHKLSTRLVRENQALAVEDLHVQGMLKNHRLAGSIADAAWSELVRQLDYKCRWYGRDLHPVDRWFPSSKTCGSCGHVLDELRLERRRWQCPACGAMHDRDVNAARNILVEGMGLPRGTGEVTHVERGDCSPRGPSAGQCPSPKREPQLSCAVGPEPTGQG